MAPGSFKHILVVDDDEMMREYMKELLQLNDFIITEAENGKAGLKAFREASPDLVVTDIIMPEMEGITFIKEMRSHNKNIPIIAMTGNVHGRDDEYLGISSKLGADEVLKKPVKADDFIETINRLI